MHVDLQLLALRCVWQCSDHLGLVRVPFARPAEFAERLVATQRQTIGRLLKLDIEKTIPVAQLLSSLREEPAEFVHSPLGLRHAFVSNCQRLLFLALLPIERRQIMLIGGVLHSVRPQSQVFLAVADLAVDSASVAD